MPSRDLSERGPKVWGRRPYAGKGARELLNDTSTYIWRTQPADVPDPTNPTLGDVMVHAGRALDHQPEGGHDTKAATLVELLGHGLTFQEAVVWYWFRYCRFDITEIHFAIQGSKTGGDPAQRRGSVRNILRVLKSAASKVPDASADDVPGMLDDRRRHDRAADDWMEVDDQSHAAPSSTPFNETPGQTDTMGEAGGFEDGS